MRRKSENKRMFLLLSKAKLRENGRQRLCLVSKVKVSAILRRDSPNRTTMSINTTHRPSQPLRHLIGSLSSTELFGFQRTIIRGLLGCHSVLFTDCMHREASNYQTLWRSKIATCLYFTYLRFNSWTSLSGHYRLLLLIQQPSIQSDCRENEINKTDVGDNSVKSAKLGKKTNQILWTWKLAGIHFLFI